MKKKKQNKFIVFRIVLLILFVISYGHSAWIVKIDNTTIESSEFQDFVDYNKYILGVAGQKRSNTEKVRKDLFAQFVDNELILLEAKKKKVNEGSIPNFKKLYESEKNKWLAQVYLSTQLNMKSMEPSENEVKREFDKMKQSGVYQIPKDTKYNSLNKELQFQIKQRVAVEKINKLKDKYREKLEKKYMVKRNSMNDIYVASVKGDSISKSDVNVLLKEQLNMVGASFDSFKGKESELLRYRKLVLNDLILNKILLLKMKEEQFSKKKEILLSLKFIKKQIVLQYFLKKFIYDKIKVSSKEKDNFYKKNVKGLKNRPFEQVNSYIEGTIRQEKAKDALINYINGKKEGYVIKRNMERFKNIKF